MSDPILMLHLTTLKREIIERYDGPDGVTYAAIEDDGWTPPTQYLSAARTYASGLQR